MKMSTLRILSLMMKRKDPSLMKAGSSKEKVEKAAQSFEKKMRDYF
jgi:hypothetical protein